MKLRVLSLIQSIVLAVGLSLQAVIGQAAADVAGSADLELLSRYPNSWIVDYSQRDVPEYGLATGSMKKINGVIAPELQQYITGRLTRITYRLPSGRGSADALLHFQSQFDRLPQQTLFSCDGRGCGESNRWANVQLGIARLYGIDREQHYRALKLQLPNSAPAYLAFYTVKRGNKRVYVQIDLIEPAQVAPVAASGAGSLVAGLQNGQRVVRSAVQLDSAQIQALIALLDERANQILVLVGHSESGALSDQHRAVSLQLADALKQKLVEKGVAASRIETVGVGSLAPAYDDKMPGQRVEWLLRSR